MSKKEDKQEEVMGGAKEYPRLLSNHVCGKDLFEGHSHELIARRIVRTINDDKSVHAIGLDGGWGSGKSNVIEQVKGMINPSLDLLFVYDAWAYQSDPQKRSILESIIAYLAGQTINGKKKFDSEEWKNRAKNLLSKRKETDVVETPRLGWGLIFSVLALVSTPILKYIADTLTNRTWLQVLVLMVPLFVILGVFVRYAHKSRQAGNEHWIKDGIANALSIYAGKKHETTSLETISEEEPSSSVFKKWMHDIDTELESYNLILVFDNIDRLTVEKVRELWSVINALFAEQEYKNIVTIVPFDREHIQFTFKTEDIKKQDEIVTQSYGDDFINKTFNVVYRVSPPIMTAWKKFFEDKWEEAFGAKCVTKVLQIFDTLSDKITPRQIIAFINRFVAIRQVIEGEIPDEYIALYIFGEDSIKKNPYTKIIVPDYLGALKFMYAKDDEFPKYIAALYFQVTPEMAIEVAYVDRLRQALDENNADIVKQIASLSSFGHILSKAIIDVVNVPNAVEALSVVEEKVEPIHWNELYVRLDAREGILQDYQKTLLKHIDQKDLYLKRIVQDFYSSESFTALKFYRDIKALDDMGLEVKAYLQQKTVDPKEFIPFVQEAKEDYTLYNLDCNEGSLDQYLAQLKIEDLSEMTAVKYLKSNYKTFDQYRKHIEALVNDNISDIASISICYQRLKELEKPVTYKMSDSNVAVLFQVASPKTDIYYDLLCMRMARLGGFNTGYTSIFAQPVQSTDEQKVENVSKTIEYYLTYGDILMALPQFAEQFPLLKAVAQQLTRHSYGISTINTSKVLLAYDQIKTVIELDAETLLSRFNAWAKFVNLSEEQVAKLSYTLLDDSSVVKNALTKKLTDAYLTYLNTLSMEDWKKKIIAGNTEYKVITQLNYRMRNAFEAFKSLLIEHARGNVNMDAQKVAAMVDWANRHRCGLISAFKELRDCFINEEGMTPPLFSQYADYLFKYARLEERQESLRKIFTSPILDNAECLVVMLQNQDVMAEIVEKAGEEAQDFKDKMLSLWENKYAEDAPDGFEEFMARIGVEREEREDNENVNK